MAVADCHAGQSLVEYGHGSFTDSPPNSSGWWRLSPMALPRLVARIAV
jgi:hypothetical protein